MSPAAAPVDIGSRLTVTLVPHCPKFFDRAAATSPAPAAHAGAVWRSWLGAFPDGARIHDWRERRPANLRLFRRRRRRRPAGRTATTLRLSLS